MTEVTGNHRAPSGRKLKVRSTGEQARQAALVATQAAADAFGTLRSSAGDTVRLIRAFAEAQAKPTVVYNLAQIPPPASPSPAPPPAQPTELTVTLDASGGNLTLRWKAANPAGTSGTSYIIRRRAAGVREGIHAPANGWEFIGVSGKKEFVDDTLIAGPDSVQYTVQGQRADSSGPLSPILVVNFGQAPGGGMTASVMADHRRDAGATDHRLETGATASTVDGRTVQKVLPSGNGSANRSKSRG